MAIGVTEAVAEVSIAANQSVYAMGAFTPTANAILVVFVYSAGCVLAAPTMTGGGLTWTLEQANLDIGGSGDSEYTFWAKTGASPSSTTITFDCTGDESLGTFMNAHSFTGADITSPNPIRQMAFNSSGGGSSANPNVTFASALLTGNGYCAIAGNARNPFAATPPTGWTESSDDGFNLPERGSTSAFRAGGETGTVITFTATSSVWGMVAVEVKVAPAAAGIERDGTLYPLNSTTVDSGAGIDVRILSDAQAGATDSTQSVRFTHTQDGQERTFDPANALVTTETDPLTFQGEGWALRLAEDMTPMDDANCNAILKTGTVTVNVRALLNMNGGTNLGGSTVITFRSSLWRYNTSANTGTLIASGSQSNTWDTSAVGGENNTRKNTAISITVASQAEFVANEVFMVQIGCEGTTLPNATLGTTNFDITLDVDDAATNVTFGGIRVACVLSATMIGKGVVSESAKAVTIAKTLIGKGEITISKAVVAAKVFSLIGKGQVSRVLALAEDFDLVGKGTPTMTRVVVAAKSFTLDGRGSVTRVLLVALPRTATGKGEVTSAKAVIAAKAFSLVGKGQVTRVLAIAEDFDLIGKGTPTMTRSVISAKSFSLQGSGVVTRVLAAGLMRSATGNGDVTFAKAVLASKSFSLIGLGTVAESRSVQAYRTFTLTGKGEVSRRLAVAEDFDLVGLGNIAATKAVVASKSFALGGAGTVSREILVLIERTVIGKGLVTEVRTVQAFRTFNLVGKGEILTSGPNASTITIPIDEVPTEGGGGDIINITPIYVFDD